MQLPSKDPIQGCHSIQTTSHTHETKDIKWHECKVETEEPEPERCFTPSLIQFPTEHFRPVEDDTCEHREHYTTNNYVMEVSNQE